MLASFKPSVVGISYLVTAQTDVRDQLWSALSETHNDMVERERGGKTQFIVKPFPEYTGRQVYILTVAYLYSILSDLPLEDFMAQSPGYHLKSAHEMISLSPGSETGSMTEQELMDSLTMRMARLAYIEVKRLYRNVEHAALNSSTVYDWWQGALTAYRRLQFVKSSETFISAVEWTRRSEEALQLVEALEVAYQQVLRINVEIKVLVTECEDHQEAFGEVVDQAFAGQLSVSNLLLAYQFVTADIRGKADRIKVLADSFPEESARQAVRRIKVITPVE